MNAIELYREFPETETREQQALMAYGTSGSC